MSEIEGREGDVDEEGWEREVEKREEEMEKKKGVTGGREVRKMGEQSNRFIITFSPFLYFSFLSIYSFFTFYILFLFSPAMSNIIHLHITLPLSLTLFPSFPFFTSSFYRPFSHPLPTFDFPRSL